jgi:hypothetical protein
MGYGTRDGQLGHSIRTFWPDDTDTEMYIDAGHENTLAELIEKINDKWPGASMSNITMSAEHIHTDCLGYDLYDPGDYTMFIVITRHVEKR